MDPLSISMSILTIIGAVTSTIKAAKSVYNAPEELESLLNDLTEGELMVRVVKDHLAEYPHNLARREVGLQERLSEAESILVALKTTVTELLANPDNPRTVNRYAWLKSKKKTRKLTRKLAQIHKNFPGSLARIEGSHIKLELSSLSNVQSETISNLSRIESLAESTSQTVMDLREEHEDYHQVLTSSMQQLRLETSHRLQRIESTLAANTDVVRILPTIVGNSVIALPPRGTDPRNSGGLTTASLALAHSSYQSIAIRSQYRPSHLCDPSCQCQCHERRTEESPSFLNHTLGRIFIGYKGLPILAKFCNKPNCKRTSHSSVYVTYYFPKWCIKNRMMILVGNYGAIGGPTLALSFPRIIPTSSSVIMHTQHGNIAEVKSLFLKERASPNDISHLGISLLEWALTYKQWSTFKFLCQAGANTKTENIFGRTAQSLVCEYFFIENFPNDFVQWVAESFLSAMIDEYGFHALHESILDLRHTSVSEEVARLVMCSDTINSQDNLGNTPLWWACARDDYRAALYLLSAGADPNIANKQDMRPFQASMRYGAVRCAKLLLENASVDVTSTHSLQLAIAGLKPLTEDFLDELLKRGIDIESVGRGGFRAIDNAIEVNQHTALRWLLHHGAEYRHCVDGLTILHYLAWFGDLESVRIMREACLSIIDIHAKSHENTTAMELLLGVGSADQRPEPACPKLIASFARLLKEIEERTQGKKDQDVQHMPSILKTIDLSSKGISCQSDEISELQDVHTKPRSDTDEENDDDFHDAVEAQDLDFPVVQFVGKLDAI